MLKQIVPYEDEYISSVFERFCIANGFPSYGVFESTIANRASKNNFYHEPDSIAEIMHYMKIENWGEFYIKHSLFPFFGPLMTDSLQISYLSGLFNLKGARHIKQKLGFFVHCPLCDKEVSYVHRSHNLPGVKVCHKHKISLCYNDTPITENFTDEDILYAVYAKDYVDKELEVSLTTMNEIYTFNLGKNFYRYLEKDLTELLKVYLDPEIVKYSYDVKESNCPNYLINYSNGCFLDLTCKGCGTRFFSTVYGLLNNFACPYCQSLKTDKELFVEHIEMNDRYRLLSDYISPNEYVSLIDKNTNQLASIVPVDFRNKAESFDKVILNKLGLYFGKGDV